jgi:hypothetical protein
MNRDVPNFLFVFRQLFFFFQYSRNELQSIGKGTTGVLLNTFHLKQTRYKLAIGKL